jgi:RNA polymerase sigma factor (sigma-70 family)
VIECSVDTERQGDAVAAAIKVFAEHGDFIRAMIRLRVHNASRRDDVFQELFLKLISQPVPLDVQNVRGYLYRAIVHDSVDLSRARENDRRHLKNYAEKNKISIHKTPSPIAMIEEIEEKGSGLGCLTRQLRRREAQVVTLRYRDNYSIAEIAAELGIRKRSVSRYLTSGLRELRRTLAVE